LSQASDKKAGPFERALKHLYTKATLIGEELDASDDAAACAGGSNYLMCMNEEEPAIAPGSGGSGGGEGVGGATISLVAIELGTGDIVYDTFEDNADRTAFQTRIEHLRSATESSSLTPWCLGNSPTHWCLGNSLPAWCLSNSLPAWCLGNSLPAWCLVNNVGASALATA
jgi:hypothetical protein